MQQFVINKKLSFFYLNSDDIEKEWEDIKFYLEKSVPYSAGYISLEQYKDMITKPNTNYAVWKVCVNGDIRGAIVTKFERLGECLILDYETMGGSDMYLWLEESIINFEFLMEKQFNVTQFRIVGRNGWSRVLKKIGYELSHTVTIRKINKEKRDLDGNQS